MAALDGFKLTNSTQISDNPSVGGTTHLELGSTGKLNFPPMTVIAIFAVTDIGKKLFRLILVPL